MRRYLFGEAGRVISGHILLSESYDRVWIKGGE